MNNKINHKIFLNEYFMNMIISISISIIIIKILLFLFHYL
jgi:hypothetical protein